MTNLYQWASARCARKEYCRSEMQMKLRQHGATADEAEAAVERLEREGFIDDLRYARAFVSDKFRFEHWGRVKMRYALLRKGVSDCDIDEAFTAIAEADYRQALLSFVKSRRSTTDAERSFMEQQRVARAAIQRGYEPQLVFEVLNLSE